MPSTDSEPTSMEDSHALEDEEGSMTDNPSSVPPTTVPTSSPLVQTTTRPTFTSEAVIETKAVSMASTDCSSALSSPAEASPAKAAVTSPMTLDGTIITSPATSHIASASDSLTCTGTSLINISESKPSLPVLPSSTFGSPDQDADFPAVLTFKGVSVTLENNSVWKQFYSLGTEMILTKQGRRMFPYCRYRLSGLDPERQYSLVLSIVPSDRCRYRWNTSRWEVTGPAENQAQGLIRAFSHHYSPCRGSDWMGGLVSFYKLKLTNNSQDREGHMILHSMHRYIPRLHVIPVPDGVAPTPDQPVVMGPESMTFTFPQTEFMAVTTYQNFRITQLKINHNPFAKGFREDGNNSRLNRIPIGLEPGMKMEAQPLKPVELDESMEEVVDLSTKKGTVSAAPSGEQETRLVLKPIMSTSASKDDPFVPCMRGKHALGELVLVQKRPRLESKEETHALSVSPVVQKGFRTTSKGISLTPTSTTSTPGSSTGFRKRRKKINRRWGNSRGRLWKDPATSPAVVQSLPLTVSTQPELDDVEGLLFVSFTSKEALEVHVREKPADNSASVSPGSTPMHLKQTVDVIPEAHEEKLAHLEALLLQDLQVFRHRQVIHPVLLEVGMKLSSLDPTNPIDLQYLGVHLPLPPPNPPEQDNNTSPGDGGLPFISRTGKTSDITKIKGWKNKFIRSKETSPSNCDGSQKNLSAFCSNMLDEYLESEAQYISERAAAFSTNPEGSVAYQLPAKSSSYVKTLDSVLKHRKSASKFSVGANKPCPLSHKPALYSALTTPAPALTRPVTPVQAAQSTQQSAASWSNGTGSVSQSRIRLSTYKRAANQRSTGNNGQSQWTTHRPTGFTKFQFKLLLMELGAINEGLDRTQLTADRLSVALSVLLTKEMQPSQVLRVSHYPAGKSEAPECGQDFCRLGCVCSSLQHQNRGPLHCQRPECMFGCACFKRKITKQMNAGESEEQIQPVYSMTNMEHVVQPRPGSHANKLWNGNIDGDVDPDPIFIPKGAPLPVVPAKFLKRCSVPRPTQQKTSEIQEEDKGPVYRYLESMMTCARVREFNSKPPEIPIDPTVPDTSTQDTTEKLQETTTDILPKMYYRTLKAVKKSADKTPEGTTSSEADARKQIEIQSACRWDKDCKMVLEALCRRMKQNRLSQRFFIGPYRIRPVTKIFMKKPSGNIVTYRIHISKPSKASDNDEDESDDSNEEKHADKSLDEDTEPEEEEEIEEPEMRLGVTPFLSGVLPAGRLRAKTKPVGCQAYGLIQVNGKAYNQARLLLGNMGSLHPANRLAAYVTGRLHAPADISQKNSQKSDPTNKINPLRPLHIKAAGTVVPQIITARKTTELKTSTQPPVQLSQPDLWRKGSISLPQLSENSSTNNPIQTFVLGQRSLVDPFQNGSTSSSVSLTVSPSLKTPSFLGKSGTYSFRICPPAAQGTRGQRLPGVTLPGGFTLIQLPKPGATGAAQQSVSTANVAGLDKALPQKDGLFKFSHLPAKPGWPGWPGLGTLTGAQSLLSSRSGEPGSSRELMCDEKMPSDESDEANRQVDSNLDIEDLSSDSSDYCAEGDEDDEVVDIETVEEVGQGLAIAKMKEAVRRAQESRDSSDDFGSANVPDLIDIEHGDARDKRRRKNHTVLERQRRTEQRNLFDKLQSVLQADPKVPRLRLLSMALREIKHQVDTAKYLEEKKRTLVRLQSVYIRELSLLSGKSEQLIKDKLKEICERQKMREKTMKWSPFFSNLLQSRAALLQAITPESELQPKPLLKPELFMNPFKPFLSKPHTTAAQKSVDQTPKPTPHPLPLAVTSPAQAEVSAPSAQAENQPGESGAPAQVNKAISQTCQPQVPSVTAISPVPAAQDGASPTPSTPNSSNPSVHPSQPFSLPLIRSKTGRIILPSSLKPIGNGFYTLMVLNPKQTGEKGEVNKQPSDMNSSNNQDKSHALEEQNTVQSSTSLLELCRLNKSIFSPSVALQKNSEAGGAVVSLNKMPSVCLSFKHGRQSSTVPASVKSEPDPSTSAARRGRGRPRKNAVGENGEHPGEDASKSVSESETSILIEESEKTTVEVTKDSPGVVNDNPVPVKRGRGRPPKNKLGQLRSPPIIRAGSSQSKSNEDSPFRAYLSDTKPKESPDTTTLNTSRPLTRGALGKDFPSAKKRSWIDMEKELEPELESESE